jgi:hypothetical protein
MLAVEQIELSEKRGDTQTYTLYFCDDDGAREDITGWTVFFTAKIKSSDLDTAVTTIKKDVTVHTDPTNGETQIFLTSTDLANVGRYIFDVQVKTATGDIKTILEGNLIITQDITTRTS